MLIAIIALLAFAAGFWGLWIWSWHEIGYWTLAAIGLPVLILTAFTESHQAMTGRPARVSRPRPGSLTRRGPRRPRGRKQPQ
jgi:hypothetical protein